MSWFITRNRSGRLCVAHPDGTHDVVSSYAAGTRECCRLNFLERWQSRLRVTLRVWGNYESSTGFLGDA
jgi:hypothetical protein